MQDQTIMGSVLSLFLIIVATGLPPGHGSSALVVGALAALVLLVSFFLEVSTAPDE